MVAFWIAVVLGGITAIVYLALALRSFRRVRRSVLAGAVDEIGDDATFSRQGGDFTWKAGAGVVASITVIACLSLGGGWWYLVPFLAIGSAVAVVVAFLYDELHGDDAGAGS
jgi:hypothetical protein